MVQSNKGQIFPPNPKYKLNRGDKFMLNGIVFEISELSNRKIIAKSIGDAEKRRPLVSGVNLYGPDGKLILR